MSDADIFVPEDGDGEPSFMHIRHTVRAISESWFPAEIFGQPAKLLEILSAPHQGRRVAITSRLLQSIDQQMSERGFASVVVRPITNPTITFNERTDFDVGGMTVLRRIDDTRFG